jgi:two-component system, response regulator PdtaR
LPGERVLVVEDEDLIRLILAEALEAAGYRVIEADTGDEAARLLDGPGEFDLVVTDVQVPGALDGVAIGRHARTRHPYIPVIYATGRPESMVGARPLGPREVLLRKPYGPREVVATARALLRG